MTDFDRGDEEFDESQWDGGDMEDFDKIEEQLYGRRPEGLRFMPIRAQDVTFDMNGFWRVKKLFPMQGVGMIYGPKKSYKSFTASDICFAVARGVPWCGLRTAKGAVVYVVAEGVAGFRKRIAAYRAKHGIPADVAFHIVEVAPNLGTGPDDAKDLVDCLIAYGVTPALVVIDTVAQTMHGANENNEGMSMFISNIQKISAVFDCFVLGVHHVGHTDQDRMRGHSSLGGAVDVSMLVTKDAEAVAAGRYACRVEIVDSKDDESGYAFNVELERFDFGRDDDGDQVTTLLVKKVERLDVQAVQAAKEEAKATKKGKGKDRTYGGKEPEIYQVMRDFEESYHRLADGVKETRARNGQMVRKVKVAAIRADMRERGDLRTDDNGNLTNAGSKAFGDAKARLIKRTEDDKFWLDGDLIWKH